MLNATAITLSFPSPAHAEDFAPLATVAGATATFEASEVRILMAEICPDGVDVRFLLVIDGVEEIWQIICQKAELVI